MDYAYGYCGMPCALCTRYRTDGKSRCHGCSHDGYYTVPCKVYRCCRERGLAHCGECAQFPCARLGKMGDFRDLNTGRVKQRTCAFIAEHGFDAWYRNYDLDMLRALMRRARSISGTPKEAGKAFRELVQALDDTANTAVEGARTNG